MFGPKLEREPPSQLHGARPFGYSGDLRSASGGRAWTGSGARQRLIRRAEIGVIERVRGVRAYLQFDPLVDAEALARGKVEVVQSRTDYRIPAQST